MERFLSLPEIANEMVIMTISVAIPRIVLYAKKCR